MTVQELSGLYFSYIELFHRVSTLQVEKHCLEKFREYFGNTLDVSTIKHMHMELWLLNKFKSHPSVAHSRYRILKAMFNWAISNELVTTSPLSKIKLPKEQRKLPAFLTKDELEIILSCEPNQNLRYYYQLSFYTGLRLGELQNLEWASVNFSRRTIVVANTETFKTKSLKDRVIPLCNTALNILTEMYKNRQEQKYVVVQWSRSYISHKFCKAVRRAGMDKTGIHFHSLRHSCASNLAIKGVSLYIIKEILGHTDYQTTMIYSHLNQKPIADALLLLD